MTKKLASNAMPNKHAITTIVLLYTWLVGSGVPAGSISKRFCIVTVLALTSSSKESKPAPNFSKNEY